MQIDHRSRETRRTVLVVGHDEALAALILHALRDFDVLTAKSTAEAYLAVDRLHPDLVLVDADSVDGEVHDLCWCIRRGWPDGPKLLVMMRTSSPERRVECYGAGADDCIALPTSEVEILAKCRNLAGLQRETQLRRLKAELLDLVAHELRTPLTGIKMAVDELSALGAGEALDHNWVQMLHDCERRLELLADHGLLLCEFRSNAFQDKPEPCDLVAVVSGVADRFADPAVAKDVRIEVRASGPVAISIDRRAVETLLGFLLESVLRWCRRGVPIVLVVRAEEHGASLSLSASTSEILPVSPFDHLVPRTDDGQLVGGDLGLSLVAEIVDVLNGSVDLTSSRTDELSVTFQFPQQSPNRRGAERLSTQTPARLQLSATAPCLLVDVSTSGCAVETDVRLPVEIQVDHGEPVRGRIVRAQMADGRMRLGVQFDTPLAEIPAKMTMVVPCDGSPPASKEQGAPGRVGSSQ